MLDKKNLLSIYIVLQITVSSCYALAQTNPISQQYQAPDNTTLEQLRSAAQENHIFERTCKLLGAGHSANQYYKQLQQYPLQLLRVKLQDGNNIQYYFISTRGAKIAYYTTTAICKYNIGKWIGKKIDNL